MKTQPKHLSVPLIGAGISLLALVILAATTSPIDNIAYAVVFFGLLTVFLTSLGYLFTRLRRGRVTRRSRHRILIVSCLVLVGLMLRSSGSLDWVEALVLGVIGIGLWFYSGRR